MHLNPKMLKDTLTVEVFTPGAENPLTGASSGGSTAVYLTQPASDQDLRLKMRGNGVIINGVPGALPVSICYTAAFPLPVIPAGGSVVYRVNGRKRPLLRAGPPVDIGGQGQVFELELAAPED